jgi:hypothetical protein
MKPWILVAALAFGLPGMALMEACTGTATPANSAGVEIKVKFEDCPQAVQDTIKKEAGSGTIKDIDKETENGKLIYSAEVLIDGKLHEVNVEPDGKLISNKLDDGKD